MTGFARLNHLSGYWAKDGFTVGARAPERKGAVGWDKRVKWSYWSPAEPPSQGHMALRPDQASGRAPRHNAAAQSLPNSAELFQTCFSKCRVFSGRRVRTEAGEDGKMTASPSAL